MLLPDIRDNGFYDSKSTNRISEETYKAGKRVPLCLFFAFPFYIQMIQIIVLKG